ncbi:MAG: cation:proton antiporter, partial [Candidatus Tumulicola sp.]
GAVPETVFVFVVILGAALLVSIAVERMRIPPAVPLVAVGAIVGSVWHLRLPFAFGPALLFVFLPPLIFEAAWNIDVSALRTRVGTMIFLALPGTLLSAFAVAAALTLVGALPFGAALLLGAIVSATDPVAVVAIFAKCAVPAATRTLVEAESIANDGVAVVLYGIAFAAVSGLVINWGSAALHGVAAIVIGLAIGAAMAVPIRALVARTTAPEYEVTATIALAYGAYVAASFAHASGIFATAAAALTLRALVRRRLLMENQNHVDAFWRTVAYIVNAAVFLVTGLLIDLPRAIHEPVLVIAAIAALAVSRAILAAVSASDWPERVTVYLAGMRGALPLALALALPPETPQRAAIIDGVFAVVLVTLVIQGAVLRPVLERLYGAASGEHA